MEGSVRAGGGRIGTALVVLLTLLVAVEAKAETGWDLTILSGVEEVGSRDAVGSPMAYQGQGYPLGLELQRSTSQWSMGFRSGGFGYGFNGGMLTAELFDGERHWAESIFIDTALWAERRVAAPGDHRLLLGLQLSHWAFYRSYHYDPTQIGTVETWDSPVTLDVRAGLQRQLTERFELRVSTSLALGGRMLRPNYAVRGDERIELVETRRKIWSHGSWVTWNRLQMIQNEATLQFRLNPRLGLVAQYRMGLLNFNDESSATRAFSHRGLVGLQFRWP